MRSGKPRLIVVLAAFTALAASIRLAAQEHPTATRPASCYSYLVSGLPLTLSAFVQSMNSNGTVVVNGVDSQGPNTPFQWSWGDGSSTTGWFPQTHVYASASQNYAITITATENSGATQRFSFPLFFIAPSITPMGLPGVLFQIPSQMPQLDSHWDGYAPPTNVTAFPDSAFTLYSRPDVAYVLAVAASIQKDFANDNTFLLPMPVESPLGYSAGVATRARGPEGSTVNGLLEIDMLEMTSGHGGGASWYTTPMSVAFSSDILAPVGPSYLHWHILFNEPGKDVTLNSPVSLTYGGHTDGGASEIYSETMGDIFGYAAGCELISNAASYGIGDEVAADIENAMLPGAASLQSTFNAYVAAGAPFCSWNNGGPDPTVGTFTTLAWKFIEHAELQGLGYRTPAKRLMKLLQMFDPAMLTCYAPQRDTQAAATFRSTLMVAALSYAFSQDLRSEFRSLNFPIDDQTFEQLLSMAAGGGGSVPPCTITVAPQQ